MRQRKSKSDVNNGDCDLMGAAVCVDKAPVKASNHLVGSSSVSVAHALLDEHDGGGDFLRDNHASYAARCRARSDEQHKVQPLSFEGKDTSNRNYNTLQVPQV
jgi:hypothetical protein